MLLHYTGRTRIASSNNPQIIMLKVVLPNPACFPPSTNTSCAKAQDVPCPPFATEQIEAQGSPTSNTTIMPTTTHTTIVVPSFVEENPTTATILQMGPDFQFYSGPLSWHWCHYNHHRSPFVNGEDLYRTPEYTCLEARLAALDLPLPPKTFNLGGIFRHVPTISGCENRVTITPQSDSDPSPSEDDADESPVDSSFYRTPEYTCLEARLAALNLPSGDDPTGVSSFLSKHSTVINMARFSVIVMDYMRDKKKDRLRTAAFLSNVAGCCKFSDVASTMRFLTVMKGYFSVRSIRPQSESTDYIRDFFSGGSATVKKHLPLVMKKILALVASVSIMPKLLSSESGSLSNMVGHLMKKRSVVKFGVISDVMDFLVNLVNDAIDWICGVRTPKEIAAVMEESKQMRMTQLEFAHTMTDVQRNFWMKEYPGVLDKLKKFYAVCFVDEDFALVGLIDRERELLVKSFVAVSDTKFQTNHLTLAMNFCGDSCIGKSLITDAVSDIVAMYYQGVPFDPVQKFVAGDTKHWDSLNNGTKLVIVDDLDADKLYGESRGDRGINGSLCSLLINLVNYMPFTPPMACADQKGKINPNPYALLISSNESHRYGDIGLMGDPTAGARRLISVEVELRHNFRSLSGGLDPSLVGDFYVDSPWLFTIRRYDTDAAVIANKGVENPRFMPSLYKVSSIIQTVEFDDIGKLTDEETLTVSQLPREDGLYTYTKQCERVPLAVLRDWIVVELDSYKSRSSVVNVAKDKTFSNSKDYFANRDAHVGVTPQARGRLDFYEHMDCAPSWPMWTFCGKVCATDAEVVSESAVYASFGWTSWFLRWLAIYFRLFTFPFFLMIARLTGGAPSGVFVNLRVFYVSFFFNMLMVTSVLGSATNPVYGLIRQIFSYRVLPIISAGLSSCNYFAIIRRAACHHAALLQKHRRASQLIVGGMFAGLSILMIKKVLGFYKSLSEVNRLSFFPQSEEADDEPPLVAPVPPVPSAPVSAGVVAGSPLTTNSLLRARAGVPYTGKYNGNPNDTTRPVLAFQDNPCMAFPDVLGAVQNNMVKLFIEAVDTGDLTTAKSIDGKSNSQFGLILGQTSTSAVILLNNHIFKSEAEYFKVQVYWKEGQRVRPVIIPRAFIAFGSELPRSRLNGLDGSLDVALLGVQDMGAVRDITGLFAQKSAFGKTDMTNVKRIMCPSMVGNYCHQEELELLSGTYHGIKTVNYSIGNMPETTFLGACVEGVGAVGTCGLPYIAGRTVVGIHEGAHAPFVYAAPITQGVITDLWNNLQQKAIPGCTNAHIVIGTPLLADPGVSATPPIVNMTNSFGLHPDSVLRTIAPNTKYSIVGNSGSGGVAFRSAYKKSPLKGHLYGAIPALKEVGRAHSTPNPDIHVSHTKMFDKTGLSTKVEPFSLRKAYKDVKTDMESNFIKLAVGDYGYVTQLGPCNMDDALAGYGCTLAGPVELTTSAGTLKGKKDVYFDRYFDEVLGRYVTCLKEDGPMSQYIVDTVDGMVGRAQMGITSTLSRKVVPKDEPREHERDLNGLIVSKAARLIHAGELVELIVFRMYFLPIMAVLGMDPGGFGHAVGLNPAESWGDLHKRFSRLDDTENFATDYSSFDLTISVHLLDAAVNLLISLTHMMSGYTDEHRRIMRVICYDLCNPIYDVDGTWVRFTGSNSSGNPLTTMLNCLVNHLVWNQVWIMWSHDRKNPTQSGLYHFVSDDLPALSTVMSLTCLGDDFFGAVTRACGFTQIDAVIYAARLGFTLTGADKGAEITPYASSISFLKRRMIVYQTSCGELVLAPLSMTSLLRPFIWGEWKVDMIEHYAGLIKGMLVELVQHGPEVYEEYVSLFRSFTSEFHIIHHTSDKRADIKETLGSYFSPHNFRSWEDRITEMYGNGKQIYVEVDSARMV